MTLATAHLAETAAPVVDRDGRAVIIGRVYAWRSSHGSRSGRVVRVETHGEGTAIVLADDSGGEVCVRARGLVRLAGT